MRPVEAVKLSGCEGRTTEDAESRRRSPVCRFHMAEQPNVKGAWTLAQSAGLLTPHVAWIGETPRCRESHASNMLSCWSRIVRLCFIPMPCSLRPTAVSQALLARALRINRCWSKNCQLRRGGPACNVGDAWHCMDIGDVSKPSNPTPPACVQSQGRHANSPTHPLKTG